MWTKIRINSSQIKFENEKSALVKLPKSSNAIWITNKCIRNFGEHGSKVISINTEWDYLTNKKARIGGEEFLSYFGESVIIDDCNFIEHKPVIIKEVPAIDDSLIK